MTDDHQTTRNNPGTTSWLNRVAWRRVLPIVQVALAITLLAVGYAHEHTLKARREAAPVVALPEGAVAFDPVSMNHYLEPTVAVCFSINFPAAVIAAPFPLLLESAGYEGEWLGDLFFVGSVAILWYLIGRAIDRRSGSIPSPHPKPHRPIVESFQWIGFVTCALIAILGLVFARPWHSSYDLFRNGGLVVWSAVFAAFLALRLFRNRRP